MFLLIAENAWKKHNEILIKGAELRSYTTGAMFTYKWKGARHENLAWTTLSTGSCI
jgi:hypothetical protein